MHQTLAVRLGCRFGRSLLAGLDLRLNLRELAVLKLCRLLQIAVLLCKLNLRVYGVLLLAKLRNRVYFALLILPLGLRRTEFVVQLSHFLLKICKTLLRKIVILLLQLDLFNLHLLKLPVHLVQLRRHGIHLRLNKSAGFIHKVNGLVRKETVGNIAIGQNRSRNQRIVLNLHAVIDLIPLLQSAENGDGILNGRLTCHNRLETTLQCRILFDVFTILIQRGRPDAMKLASCQHGLEHVAGIHGAVCFACSYDRMQLIDEQNDVPVGCLDIVQNSLQTLLKLATVLRTCNQRSHVQGEDLLVL